MGDPTPLIRPPCSPDNHGRTISYLRLAVTGRCKLRCRYCMPAVGVAFAPRRDLLTWAGMLLPARVALASLSLANGGLSR